ncbi:unnamed protein product [Bursaphelenchus xylophilus]|uniref:(pine wood nematode) hypothetical protein n=1 Tax=Bursaphelenchus xylophilus TaxID=6326 RepID=A0A1I7S935_BURXY|nr:unnamed protein product [Bursaphelenchus xylophilus]CAG9086212.1 unnamed protein product [Bursaphelenchus xylophilus]
MSAKNQVDFIVRRVLLFSKLFTDSWGKPRTLELLKQSIDNYIGKGKASYFFESRPPPLIITKEWQTDQVECLDGHFLSPLAQYYPEMYPTENVKTCHWRGHFVKKWKDRKGLVIILAPTGDHTFTLRERSFVSNLLKEGISSILVENPFYGRRKPPEQFRSALRNVTDLFVMGASLIVECNYLLKWAISQGHGPLGLAGVSLGGYMAGLAATNSEIPVAVVPCLSSTSAAPVYTRGALAEAINWEGLAKELQNPTFIDAIGKIQGQDWLYKLEHPSISYPEFDRSKIFMWILMEQFTNLNQYPVPPRGDLATFVIAEDDAYIEQEGAPDIRDIWPQSKVVSLPHVGHVLGFLRNQSVFRQTLIQMLHKAGQAQPQVMSN